MSNPERRSNIPEAPIPSGASGNLLSSIAPPTELPNFVTATSAPSSIPLVPQSMPQSATQPMQAPPVQHPIQVSPETPDKFSPVIPLSKGQPTLPIRSPEDSQTTQSPVSLPDSTPDIEIIGDPMPGSGLITWMKGAVSSGGLLHRVAEKAKSSVDSMITTLDPQMKEYLNSGGDIFIVVASDKEVKITPVREAFQVVFGKATVIGYPAVSEVTAPQPVGAAAGYAAAKQRIALLRAGHPDINNNVPIIAVESYIYEALSDRWYEVSLLVLSQPSLGIELQIQSQGTPVPSAAVAAMRAATPEDYVHGDTGYTTTVGAIMSANLQVHHMHWQEATTGVGRKDLLILAAKSLAGCYKKMLNISAAET